MSSFVKISAGCDFANLDNKITASSNGAPMNILIPSDVQAETRFTQGPRINQETGQLSTSITVQREGSGKLIGPVIVGAAATFRNHRNGTTTHRSKGNLKIDNIPVYMGALASALVPNEVDEVVFDMACTVLHEHLVPDLLKVVQGAYLVNYQGRTAPLKMRFVLDADHIIPEGSACVFADLEVQNSIVIDCGHGTTIISKRTGSVNPDPRVIYDLGMSRVIENLMVSKNVLRAAANCGQGSPRFSHVKAGILNGSLRYGGTESGFSFATDYRKEVKVMVARYEEMLDEVIEPLEDSDKSLFIMGGGANVEEVRKMIERRGGRDLLQSFPQAQDRRFLNASLLHSII